MKLMKRLVKNDSGQDLIEYALLAAFIALVCVLAVTNVGAGVNGIFEKVVAAFPK